MSYFKNGRIMVALTPWSATSVVSALIVRITRPHDMNVGDTREAQP